MAMELLFGVFSATIQTFDRLDLNHMPGKCKVLYWDRNRQVHGMIYAFHADDSTEILVVAEGTSHMSFPAQLREVSAELRYDQADVILLSGYLPEFICLELILPNLDREKIKNTLQFELPRRIPTSAGNFVVFFRRVTLPADSKHLKVRIWAVKRKVWDELQEQLREAGIKFDAFCHPFLAVELSENVPIAAFPQVAPGLVLSLKAGGNAQVWKRKSARRKEPFLKRFSLLASGFCIID